MNRKAITVCHGLILVSIADLHQFARLCSKVKILYLRSYPQDSAVPGSVKITTSTENRVSKKKISYEIANIGPDQMAELERLQAERLVAVYTDEWGNLRVCGSPDWPLSLEYIENEGGFSVTLTGEDTMPDPFVENG